MTSLAKIYWDNGISIKELASIAQKRGPHVVRNRVSDLVKMYENHPEKLEKLIKECTKT